MTKTVPKSPRNRTRKRDLSREAARFSPEGRTPEGRVPEDPVRYGGPIWLYGHHAVLAALANPRRRCHCLLGTIEAHARLPPPLGRPDLETKTVERSELDRVLGGTAVHQGLALSVDPLPVRSLAEACAPAAQRKNVVLVLDQISDPHNLGAILRSAAAFDVRAVVVPKRRSADLGGAVAKAASGALELLPLVETVNIARALDELRDLGYWRIALERHADDAIDRVGDFANCALVLGAEGKGLRRLVRDRCDLALHLPMSTRIESLNVSVAAAVALYEMYR